MATAPPRGIQNSGCARRLVDGSDDRWWLVFDGPLGFRPEPLPRGAEKMLGLVAWDGIRMARGGLVDVPSEQGLKLGLGLGNWLG